VPDLQFVLLGTFLAILELSFVFLLIYLIVECTFGAGRPEPDPD
jgi:hypothetical protein